MSDTLGPITFGRPTSQQVFLGRDISHDRNYGEEVASAIDKEVRAIIEDAYAQCRQMLVDNSDKLELIAQALLVHETLEADQLKNLMEYGTVEAPKKEEPKDEPKQDDDDTPAIIPPVIQDAEIIEEPAEAKAEAVEAPQEETVVEEAVQEAQAPAEEAPTQEQAPTKDEAQPSEETEAEPDIRTLDKEEPKEEKDGPKIVY
jgi:cell division protease FtsH